jgi:hypothetical protein
MFFTDKKTFRLSRAAAATVANALDTFFSHAYSLDHKT